MDWIDYENYVLGLASGESKSTVRDALVLGALGCAGEAGEVADAVKKMLFHGTGITPEWVMKLQLEMGDVLWYLTFLAQSLGLHLSDIRDLNIAKLSARYPSGRFSTAEFLAKERGKDAG